MRRKTIFGLMAILAMPLTQKGIAQSSEVTEKPKSSSYANQVFFRGAFSQLANSRGGEVFTDTATGGNKEKSGFSLAAGIDLALTDSAEIFNHLTLLGEVFMEYSRYSNHRVLQTTSALLGGTNQSDISVSQMNATIAPKIRMDSFESVRPFIIPAGMTWLVNSPPSNDTTYLDFGIPFAVGLDIILTDKLSVGTDFRYTYAFNHSNTENSYWSLGGYAAVNF